MQETTESYLLGITEARAFLRRFVRTFGRKPDRQEIQNEIDAWGTLAASGAGKEQADAYRGSRDFWKNQLKGLDA